MRRPSPVSSSFTPRIFEDSSVHSIACAARCGRRHMACQANASTILTGRYRHTRERGPSHRLGASQPGAKLLITGIASHLNHVADTTCHIGGVPAAAGMGVASITSRRAREPRTGRKQAGGFKKYSAGPRRASRARLATCVDRTTIRTLLHTQAGDRYPATSGVFFAR